MKEVGRCYPQDALGINETRVTSAEDTVLMLHAQHQHTWSQCFAFRRVVIVLKGCSPHWYLW